MKGPNEPLSAEAIHSLYAGKKAQVFVRDDKKFKSTSQFDRDPAHTGQAPAAPKAEKGPFRR